MPLGLPTPRLRRTGSGRLSGFVGERLHRFLPLENSLVPPGNPRNAARKLPHAARKLPYAARKPGICRQKSGGIPLEIPPMPPGNPTVPPGNWWNAARKSAHAAREFNHAARKLPNAASFRGPVSRFGDVVHRETGHVYGVYANCLPGNSNLFTGKSDFCHRRTGLPLGIGNFKKMEDCFTPQRAFLIPAPGMKRGELTHNLTNS